MVWNQITPQTRESGRIQLKSTVAGVAYYFGLTCHLPNPSQPIAIRTQLHHLMKNRMSWYRSINNFLGCAPISKHPISNMRLIYCISHTSTIFGIHYTPHLLITQWLSILASFPSLQPGETSSMYLPSAGVLHWHPKQATHTGAPRNLWLWQLWDTIEGIACASLVCSYQRRVGFSELVFVITISSGYHFQFKWLFYVNYKRIPHHLAILLQHPWLKFDDIE